MDWLDAQSVLETGKRVGASITSVQVSKSYADINVSRSHTRRQDAQIMKLYQEG